MTTNALLLMSTLAATAIVSAFQIYLLTPRYGKAAVFALNGLFLVGLHAALLPVTFQPVRPVSLILALMIVCILLFRDKMVAKVCISLISISLCAISEILILPLYRIFSSRTADYLVEQWDLMIIVAALVLLIMAILHAASALLIGRLVLGRMTPVFFRLMIPFTTGEILFGVVLFFAWVRDMDLSVAWLLLLFVLLFLISDVFLYRMAALLERQAETEAQLKSMELQMKYEQEHYKAALRSVESMRALRHDVKNQVQTAYAMLLNEDVSAARSFLREFGVRTEDYDLPAFCENRCVNALLYNKYTQTKAAGIEFLPRVVIKDPFFIPDVELCSLFSNLLDNAIEACTRDDTPDRSKRIELETIYRDGFFILRLENTCSGTVIMENGAPVSSRSKGHEGFGSRIVSVIAKRHHGSVEYSVGGGRFAVALIFPLPGD